MTSSPADGLLVVPFVTVPVSVAAVATPANRRSDAHNAVKKNLLFLLVNDLFRFSLWIFSVKLCVLCGLSLTR